MSRNAFAFVLLLLLALAAYPRFVDLERPVFGHPENYVPGRDDPSWSTAPRAKRSTLVDVLKANLDDGHPPLWFFGMFAWTEAKGTELRDLRLPSAFFGTLCVLLVGLLARREAGRAAGLLAAAFVLLNGHLLFWSRFARMYAFATALGLLATLLLLRLLDRERRSTAFLYAAAAAALLWTQAYGFALVLGHGALVVFRALRDGVPRPLATRAVALAVCAGAPVITLAIFQNPPTRWADPWSEYFELGFAFYSDAEFFGPKPARLPAWATIVPTAIGLLLAAVAAGRRATPASSTTPPKSASAAPSDGGLLRRALVVVATLATAGQTLFAWRMAGRSAGGVAPLYASCCVAPAIVVATPVVVAALRRFASRPRASLSAFASPSLVLALVPFAAMAAASALRPSFVARGASLFTPYLLAAVASGIVALAYDRDGRLRGRASLLAAFLFAAWTLGASDFSRRYFARAEAAPRDYATLGKLLLERATRDDVVLVHGGYADPPLLRYLPGLEDRVAPRGAATEMFPDVASRRVWFVIYDDDALEGDAANVATARVMADGVTAWRASAIAFDPQK